MAVPRIGIVSCSSCTYIEPAQDVLASEATRAGLDWSVEGRSQCGLVSLQPGYCQNNMGLSSRWETERFQTVVNTSRTNTHTSAEPAGHHEVEYG